jgi:hypothetical protein
MCRRNICRWRVADHHRCSQRESDTRRRLNQEIRRGLPECNRLDARCRFKGSNRGPGSRHKSVRIWVVRIAVGHDQWRTGAYRIGCDRKVVPVALAVEANRDGVDTPGLKRLRAIELGCSACIKTGIAQLRRKPCSTVDQHVLESSVDKMLRNCGCGGHDLVGMEWGAARLNPCAILNAAQETIIRYVDNRVACSLACAQEGADARNRGIAAIHHTIKINKEEHEGMVDQEARTLERAQRILVDMNNVAGGNVPDRMAAMATALRAIWPPGAEVTLFYDGGGESADDQIVAAVGSPNPGVADRIVIISDDRELRARVRALGASSVTARYIREILEGRVARPQGPRTPGFGQPPRRRPPR